MLKGILRVHHLQIKNSSSIVTSCSKCNEKIAIPQYVHRGDTDILKALAATIQQDTNGPKYQFQDDPYLTPVSNMQKRKYSLSREAGRKAARFIRDSYGNLFDFQPHEPIIEKFLPKFVLDENKPVTEEILNELIRNIQVKEAVELYQKCCDKSVELSDDSLQSLLELICFYNAEDCIDEEWLIELSARQVFERNVVKTWKDGGVAEEIFNKIVQTGSKPYCALIRGMAKYYQVDRVWQLYQESLEKDLTLDADTFASLISMAPILSEGHSARWKIIEDLLHQVVKQGIPPTLSLMNRTLDALDRLMWDHSMDLSLKVLKEFGTFGIKPSLGSYACLLGQYRKRRGGKTQLLPTILNAIEGMELTMRDPKDTWFFFKAMEICHKNLHSWETAERIHALLLKDDNYNFIGENLKESIYYRYYFLEAIDSQQLPKFFEIYDNLVPNIYSPEMTVMEQIIKAIGVQDSVQYIPRVWSDALMMECALNECIIESILMVINRHNLEEVNETLQEQLLNVSWSVWTTVRDHLENERIKKKRVEWTGLVFGDLLASLARLNAHDKMKEVYEAFTRDISLVIGDLPISALKQITTSCHREEDFGTLLDVIKYMKDSNFPEVKDAFDTICEQEYISKQQKERLKLVAGL